MHMCVYVVLGLISALLLYMARIFSGALGDSVAASTNQSENRCPLAPTVGLHSTFNCHSAFFYFLSSFLFFFTYETT